MNYYLFTRNPKTLKINDFDNRFDALEISHVFHNS